MWLLIDGTGWLMGEKGRNKRVRDEREQLSRSRAQRLGVPVSDRHATDLQGSRFSGWTSKMWNRLHEQIISQGLSEEGRKGKKETNGGEGLEGEISVSSAQMERSSSEDCDEANGFAKVGGNVISVEISDSHRLERQIEKRSNSLFGIILDFLFASLIRSFDSFIHSFILQFIHSFIHSFILSAIHSFILSFIHSFVCLFVETQIRVKPGS